MSGGYFDYNQYQIGDVIESMESIMERLKTKAEFEEKSYTNKDGEEVSYKELCNDSLDEYISDKEKFKEKLLESIKHLKLAKIYTERIDWFMSGDDGEDSFYKRLEEDLTENIK